MRTARVPDDSLPPLTRSVAACLAAILELETDEVPLPAADHPEPWTAWRVWLARRGLGLVPVERPREFAWPGPWLALLRGGIAAVAYGSPPGGLAWAPLGGSFEDIEGGYAIAPHHVALWAPQDAARPRAPTAASRRSPSPRRPRRRWRSSSRPPPTPAAGLEGDRYVGGEGTFSNPYSRGHDLTLIEAEVVDDLGVAPEVPRRNVVTRGIDLNALVGRRFRVGEVECEGQRLCEPCAHLQRLTEPGSCARSSTAAACAPTSSPAA